MDVKYSDILLIEDIFHRTKHEKNGDWCKEM